MLKKMVNDADGMRKDEGLSRQCRVSLPLLIPSYFPIPPFPQLSSLLPLQFILSFSSPIPSLPIRSLHSIRFFPSLSFSYFPLPSVPSILSHCFLSSKVHTFISFKIFPSIPFPSLPTLSIPAHSFHPPFESC